MIDIKEMTNEELVSEVSSLTIPCSWCGGSGLVYADGKTHYYHEHAETVDCPHCEGTGEQGNEEAIELLRRLNERDALRKESWEMYFSLKQARKIVEWVVKVDQTFDTNMVTPDDILYRRQVLKNIEDAMAKWDSTREDGHD